ncbi:metallophosphoesterase [Pelomonas sp. CA6]|uniref:metallophosphoesterase n=1 Tax=Pelomonas sp. CA6 TaxID=2907999 RepID=UPI001F4AA851|nr:metallophosphoesterase [Pelomonas sp. CA6]MCH7342683.1 metallophosphoesterase [Pelomonas sp. CA6]
MRFQLLSDLHLETEDFVPQPAPGAELLILAGDVDSRWEGLRRFAGWPVPVLFVPGNHEYDGREIRRCGAELRAYCADLGLRMLDDEALVWTGADGRALRILGSTRWSDFELFGAAQRERAMRAAGYFQRLMGATLDGRVFDAAAVRELGLANKAWLKRELEQAFDGPTLVVTHFAPSLRSADPRYGQQPTTASFCNDDEDLLPLATLWVHGHLHCRHDYRVAHARGETRVVCNARGHGRKGEALGFDPLRVLEL